MTNHATASYAALSRVQEAIASVPSLLSDTRTSLDLKNNQLAVKALPNLPAGTRLSLRTLLSVLPDQSVRLTDDLTSNRPAPTSSCASNASLAGLYGCTQPLRGGIGYRNTSNGEICTAGAIVRSNSDNLPYVLTAAHCFTGLPIGTPANALNNAAQWGLYGYLHKTGVPGSGTDWAIVSINSALTYEGTTLVNSSTQPGKNTTYDEHYALNSAGGSVLGAYYCKQGTVGGTACGEVVELGVNAQGATGLGMIALYGDNYACQGDSGSGVFAGGIDYGVLVQGVAGSETGVPTHPMPAGYSPSTCYRDFYYLGMHAAQSALNVHLA